MNNLHSIIRLEVYWSRLEVKYFFNFKRFSNNFTKLKELTLGSEFFLVPVTQSIEVVDRLDYFNLNVNVANIAAHEMSNLSYLIRKAKKINFKIKNLDVANTYLPDYVFLIWKQR